MVNKIVTLKNGITGRCIGKMGNGDLIMEYGKGGKVIYFSKDDIKENENE